MKTTKERVQSILKKKEEYVIKKRKNMFTAMSCMILVIAVMVGTKVVSPHHVPIEESKEQQGDFSNVESTPEIALKTFSTKEELIKAMKDSNAYRNLRRNNYGLGKGIVDFSSAADDIAISYNAEAQAVPNAVAEKVTEQKTADQNYSETNTQVQGVDEADIVKTNGDYIYYLNNNVLRIFDNTQERLTLKKEINLRDLDKEQENDDYSYISARDMYLTDEYLIVICNSGITDRMILLDEKVTNEKRNMSSRSSTKMMILDAKSYEVVRVVETEGSYLSSRKVDDDIYLITNKRVYYNHFNEDQILPLYKDTCVENGLALEVPVETIKCFPSFEEDSECSYLMITSLSLDTIDEKANVETFLGTGNEIYCSKENLYVAKTIYHYESNSIGIVKAIANTIKEVTPENSETEDRTETMIRKFAIHDGTVKYVAEGAVPGALLNQFSMDEYQNHFRVTTTRGDTWDDSSQNNLYVLDENLDIVGQIEGLAKGERIYATRFMGDKAYVVTYKTVDPLFVLNLSNPENPTVLGELKIPGYSSYLHPLGEHYLIGFGEDSVEKTNKNYDGTENVTAYSTGLKLAIFDVSDLANPKELDSVKIGGRGSSSELLHNHKSLLFKEDENIFAFPASLYSEAGSYEDGTPRYGKQEFNGFLVFQLSVENGIKLKGKIGNESKQRYSYDSPQRIIYIGDKLYSIFTNMIKVNDKDTVEEISKITFTTEPTLYEIY